MQQNKGEKFLQAFFELLAQDYNEDAVKKLRKAIKEGNLRAMYWLGKLYRNGWLGCQRSLKRAIQMWDRSIEYGPSTVILRQDPLIISHRAVKLDIDNGDPLARALWSRSKQDIDKCRDVYLEYYHLAFRTAHTPAFASLCLNEGAKRGCTTCLIELYNRRQISPWQLRRLWRHCPRVLQGYPEMPVEERLGWISVDEFGCKENIRHIICLLEWARKTQNSTALAMLPRDILRMICMILLGTAWEENQDDALVWNHLPRKKRRLKRN